MATQGQHDSTYAESGATRSTGHAANDAGLAISDYDDVPLADTVVQLPLVQQMYRAVKNWQEEFAPRDYQQQAIPAEQPQPRKRA